MTHPLSGQEGNAFGQPNYVPSEPVPPPLPSRMESIPNPPTGGMYGVNYPSIGQQSLQQVGQPQTSGYGATHPIQAGQGYGGPPQQPQQHPQQGGYGSYGMPPQSQGGGAGSGGYGATHPLGQTAETGYSAGGGYSGMGYGSQGTGNNTPKE